MAKNKLRDDGKDTLRDICTVKEVARYLRVATKTVYAAVYRGQIPAFRVGDRILISREHLLRSFDAQAKRE